VKIDISTYDMDAQDFVDLALAADEAGIDTLWLGEHVVLPVDYGSAHPTAGRSGHQQHTGAIVQTSTRLLDPMVALSAAAAITTHIRLGTAIYIAPLRHPLITARATATLDEVSHGRLRLGLGSGWLQEEFDSLGVPFDDRGQRLDECIDILRRAWAGEYFAHDGECYSFAEVQVCPQPVDVPLVLGGNSRRAIRRAVSVADGWFASGTPEFDDAVALRRTVSELRAEAGRDDEFPLWVRVPRGGPVDIDRYERVGFDHAVIWGDELWPSEGGRDEKRQHFARTARELGLTRQPTADHG
jgi:probable F420-dependent oxidoreductase